jgi:nucleotide-binding universal stress UspA family protein
MRVLVGYDGSYDATVALADLRRAGLPDDTEMLIVTVWNSAWKPPPSVYEVVASAAAAPETSLEAGEPMLRPRALERAQDTAAEAADRLRLEYPSWTVCSEALEGEPALELTRRADDWGADLVVVGSRGRLVLKRLLLGSVSRSVFNASRRSVRVARAALGREGDASVRILVGIDGHSGAECAVHEVAARSWPAGSEVRLVAVDDGDANPGSVGAWLEGAAGELAANRLQISLAVRPGAAARVLAEEARAWGADCVFVGSRSFSSAFERMRLGSVSTALAQNAPCSVEVVRPEVVYEETTEP